MELTLQDTLFSASLAVYMTASVFVAAVRWGHRCQPYARHMDYYFPAWKAVILCYLTNLFMLPAVFLPNTPDAILQLRLLLSMASPFYCAVLIFSYFGRVLKMNFWRLPVYFLAVPFGLVAVIATVLALLPGGQLEAASFRWFFVLAGCLSIAFLGCFVVAIYMVARALRRQSEENYSNPDDFPYQFAARVLWIPLLHLAVSWTSATIGSQCVLSLALLALSALSLVFLIGILTPHRAVAVDELEATPAPEASAQEEASIPEERQTEIERAIRQRVEGRKMYLNSHLQLEEVAREVGVNSRYVSLVMKARLGGFFSYINRCRLAHAAALQEAHPGMPIGEVIADSGFGSRTTYYKIKRELQG